MSGGQRPSVGGRGAPARPGALGRRVRYGLAGLAIVAFAAISLMLANLIALDPRLRVVADVTATGEHRLAPRTRQVLEALPGGAEIVVAGAAAADRDVRRRVADVLDAMARTRRVSVTWIDDPTGPEYTALLERLVERDRARLESARRGLEGSADALDAVAGQLDAVESSLNSAASTIPPSDASPSASGARAWLAQQGATARVLASDARGASASIREALAQQTHLGVPPLDRADSVAKRTLARFATEMDALANGLLNFASAPGSPREAALRARSLGQQAELARRPLAVEADAASSRRVPDLVRVLRALESAQCVLVILPDGLTAVAFDALFPPSIPETVGGARADVGAQAEDLLASALGALTSPTSPIVVFVHAEDQRFLDQGAIVRLQERLALRRIDVLEWRVVGEADPPSVSGLDPDGVRPVVYVSLSTNASAGASGPSNLTGQDRAQRLGDALRRLTDRGSSLLVCMSPSSLAALGGADPSVAFLSEFGLSADTGRPLMTERIADGRRVVDIERTVTTAPPDSQGGAGRPILAACANLSIALRWAVSLQPVDAPRGVRAAVTPLVRVPGASTWGERQWLTYWQVPPDQRARMAQPPTPDPRFDDDVTGPWTIAAAVERTAPGLSRPQRLVAVGSSAWFFDALAAQTQVVNGRVAPTVPGNAELFEASVYWLAGQESLIGRSAAAGSVPTIRALDASERAMVRWLLLGVLPLGTMVAGVVWRVARG